MPRQQQNVAPATFRVGDRVRVFISRRPSYVRRTDGVIDWKHAMWAYSGLTGTVTKVESGPTSFRLDVDNGKFSWAAEWLKSESE